MEQRLISACWFAGMVLMIVVAKAGFSNRLRSRAEHWELRTLAVKPHQSANNTSLLDNRRDDLGGNASFDSVYGPALKDIRNATNATCMERKANKFKKRLSPTLFYVGFGHSGSTTFAKVLNDHPLMSFGATKEHRYLCGGHAAYLRTKELSAFLEQFWVPCETEVTFDMSPLNFAILLQRSDHMFPNPETLCRRSNYTENVEVIQALVSSLPRALRFFAMVRNPLDWVYSRFPSKVNNVSLESEQLLEKLVERGCYASALELWINQFPDVPLKILASEDLFEQPRQFFSDFLAWLGMPNFPDIYYQENFKQSGRRRTEHTLTDKHYATYHSHPRAIECKAWLERLAGRSFSWRGASGLQ